MAYLDYDNIPTQAHDAKGERRETSLAEPDQHDPRLPATRSSSKLPVRVRKLTHHACATLSRLGKFLVVGVTGMLVNSLVLFLLYQWARLPLVLASILSTEMAIVNNFCWNDRWTFGRTRLSLNRFALFNLVSLAGMAITTGTLWLLVRHLGFYYLTANLLGIALATAWNFVANSLWTWGGAR
jgi:putative flippase GtrA